MFKAFFHAMLDQGVYLPPSAFEAWFLSAAHDDRGAPARRRRAAVRSRGSSRGRGRAVRTDRAPAAPRRGAQPAGHPLRPLGRLPPLRARPRDGRPRRRADRRPRHHPPRLLAAGAGAGDGRAARRGPRADRGARRAGDRVRQHLRGQAVRHPRLAAAPAPDLVEAVEPVPAVVGRALQATSSPGCGPPCSTPARRPPGTRPSWSPTSCRSGSPGSRPRAVASCTTRASGTARCAA